MPKRVTSLWGPSSRHCYVHPGVKASIEKMLQRWRAVGNTMFDLIGLTFEPQTSRFRDKRVTARPTGWCIFVL